MYFGKDSFDFLVFNNRFQRFRNKEWKWYWTLQQVPSRKAMKKMRANIKEVFASPSRLLFSMGDMVQLLNPKIIGMRNYYIRRFSRPWLWKIGKYINYKFTRWFNRKKQRNYRLGNPVKLIAIFPCVAAIVSYIIIFYNMTCRCHIMWCIISLKTAAKLWHML